MAEVALHVHVQDGATGVVVGGAEPRSGHVPHAVVVRGQEELAPLADVTVQEVPERPQLADVIALLRVLQFSSHRFTSVQHQNTEYRNFIVYE